MYTNTNDETRVIMLISSTNYYAGVIPLQSTRLWDVLLLLLMGTLPRNSPFQERYPITYSISVRRIICTSGYVRLGYSKFPL
jgi:hypothetical protein